MSTRYKKNRANYSGEKDRNEAFRGVYFFENTQKKLSQIPSALSFPSSNLKVSNERPWDILQVKYKGMVQELDHPTAGRIRVPGRMYRLKVMMSTGT